MQGQRCNAGRLVTVRTPRHRVNADVDEVRDEGVFHGTWTHGVCVISGLNVFCDLCYSYWVNFSVLLHVQPFPASRMHHTCDVEGLARHTDFNF